MPTSPNTDPVNVDVTPGVEVAITANGGTVDVSSIVTEESGDVTNTEGTVADGGRVRYVGPARILVITPSAADVHWTVTNIKQG